MKALIQYDLNFSIKARKQWLMPVSKLEVKRFVKDVTAYRLLNPQEPITDWAASHRKSTVKGAYLTMYIPETESEASVLLHHVPGASIVFTETPYTSPFPRGMLWINFTHPDVSKVYNYEQVRQFAETVKGRRCGGYLGNKSYQDGSKFSSTCATTISIKQRWLRNLPNELDAPCCIQI